MKTLDRRTILRGFGQTAIALPFLEAMMPAREAQAQSGITKIGKNGRPKRLIVVETQLGQGAGWFGSKSAADRTITSLSPVWKPMETHGHKNDLILIDGINNMVAMGSGQDAHDSNGNLVTCIASGGSSGGAGKSARPKGTSFDQMVAQESKGATKFESIQLAIQGANNAGNFLSVKNSAGIAPYTDPQKMFNLLFSNLQTDPLVFEKIKAQKKSILDSVRTDYEQFVAKVGSNDREKVQNHLDAVRDLETRVGKEDTSVPPSGVCAKPAAPGASATGPGRYVSKGKANMDLVTMAMACDLTRVATLDWNNVDTTGGPVFSWIAGSPLYHNISHGDANAPIWDTCSTWLVDYMAGFIDKLKAVQDGPGSLWDNTLFVWISELGNGNHTNYRSTFMAAGSAGGYLKTNQRVVYPWKSSGFNRVAAGAKSLADFYVVMMNAMGVNATTFGDPKYFTGALKELVA